MTHYLEGHILPPCDPSPGYHVDPGTINYADFAALEPIRASLSKTPTADEIACAIIKQLGLARAREVDLGELKDAPAPAQGLLSHMKEIVFGMRKEQEHAKRER
jgi:hypothetical protein